MNTEDLIAVMRAHDEGAPGVMPTADRMAAIRRDTRRARNRIGVGVVAALVVMLAAVLPGLTGARHSAPAPPAATATRDGLPVWEQGMRLTTSVSADAPGPATLRFTVPAAGTIAVGCPAGAVTMRFDVTVNGSEYTVPGLGSSYAPCSSWFGLGPLPNAELPTWSPLTGYGNDARGGSSVPGRPVTYESSWPATDSDGIVLACAATAEAPGRIDVTIDGTRIATIDIWDYTGHESDLYLTADNLEALRISPTPGRPFTISFNTREMGGRWSVQCRPARDLPVPAPTG